MKRKPSSKPWTLLIRGGRVVDPASGFDKTADVAVAGERIAAIGPNLYERRAEGVRVINASGAIVLPGLIDLHAHVFEHFTGDFGLHADLVGVESGVTALVDQGGPSALTIEGFRKHVVERSASRVLCFVSNYLVGGLHGHRYVELYGPQGVDPAAIVAATQANRDLVKGIKAHAEPGGYSRWGLEPLRLAKQASRELKIPVYVHLGTLWSPKDRQEVDTTQIVRELVPLLDPGDILAHPYTRYPSGVVGPDGKIHPLVFEAMKKGVRFDVGRGSHISFENARRAIDAGVVPFTIGADLHGYNVRKPKGQSWYRGTFMQEAEGAPEYDEFSFVSPYSLHHAMSEMRALGLPLAEVFKMATCNPAQVLGLQEEIGALAAGRIADISIVNVLEGRWTLKDSLGAEMIAREMIHPKLAIRAGKVHRATSPLLPDLAQLAA
jgi:dihydroorotase